MRATGTIIFLALAAPAAVFAADLHEVHQKEARCSDCHLQAEKKEEAAAWGWKRIGHWACGECHDGFGAEEIKSEQALKTPVCARCHPFSGKEPKPQMTRFEHARHQKTGKGCADCHAVTRGAMSMTLKMQGCVDCHKTSKVKKTGCVYCHMTARELSGPPAKTATSSSLRATVGGLETLLPRASVQASRHDPSWGKTHGRVATANEASCRECHDEKKCASCHMGRERKLVYHTGDWVTTHGIAAKKKMLDCNGCHTAQGYCLSCHQRTGVGPYAGGSGQGWKAHPQGWVSGSSPSSSHSTAAQRDISSCAACHSESTCIKCHATRQKSGLGTNPHPAGYAAKCDSLVGRNYNACLKCHTRDGLGASCQQGAVTSPLKKK
jgi:hypothetical protein